MKGFNEQIRSNKDYHYNVLMCDKEKVVKEHRIQRVVHNMIARGQKKF